MQVVEQTSVDGRWLRAAVNVARAMRYRLDGNWPYELPSLPRPPANELERLFLAGLACETGVPLSELGLSQLPEKQPALALPGNAIGLRAALCIRERACEADLREADVAQALRVSVSVLSHRMKHETGMGFWSQLHAARLDAAERLLQQMDLSISAVSRRAGYRRPSDFAFRFRCRHGCTPRQWRFRRT